MFPFFLNGGKCLSMSEVSWEGAVEREWIQEREGSSADVRPQRKQMEMGLDPEHSEKTRGSRVFSGREEGIVRRSNSTRQVQRGGAWCGEGGGPAVQV